MQCTSKLRGSWQETETCPLWSLVRMGRWEAESWGASCFPGDSGPRTPQGFWPSCKSPRGRSGRETWALTPRQAAPRPAVAPLATIRLHLQDRFLTGMLCQNVLGTCAWPLSLCSGRRDRGLLSCAGDGRLGLSFQGTPQWVWLCLGFTLCVCDVWAPCFSDATCAPGPVGERVPWPTQQETGRDVDVCFLVSLLDFLSIRLRAGQDRQVRAGSD